MNYFVSDPKLDVLALEELIPSGFTDYVWCIFGNQPQKTRGNCDVAFIKGSQSIGDLVELQIIPAETMRLSSMLIQDGHATVLHRSEVDCPEFDAFDRSVNKLMAISFGPGHTPYSILLLPVDRQEDHVRAEGLYKEFVHDAGLVLLKRWSKQRTEHFTIKKLLEIDSLDTLAISYVEYAAEWLRPLLIVVVAEDGREIQRVSYHPTFRVEKSEPFEVYLPVKGRQNDYSCTFFLPKLANEFRINSPRRHARRKVLESWIAGDFYSLANYLHQLKGERNRFSKKVIDRLQDELNKMRVEIDNRAHSPLTEMAPVSEPPPAMNRKKTFAHPDVKVLPVIPKHDETDENHFYWTSDKGWTVIFRGQAVNIREVSTGLYQSPGMVHIWNLLLQTSQNDGYTSKKNRAYELMRMLEAEGIPHTNTKASVHSQRKQDFINLPNEKHRAKSTEAKEVLKEVLSIWKISIDSWKNLTIQSDKEKCWNDLRFLYNLNELIKAIGWKKPGQHETEKNFKRFLKEYESFYDPIKGKELKIIFDSEWQYYMDRQLVEGSTKSHITTVIGRLKAHGKKNPVARELAEYLRATIGFKPFQFKASKAKNERDKELIWNAKPI